MGRLAERPDEVEQAVALPEGVQQLGGGADDLKDDRHGALFAVIVRDGQRHPLPPLVDAEDDELARLRLFGDVRGLDLHQRHRVVQRPLLDNLVHTLTPISGRAPTHSTF